ncbi:hypothetical protein LOTGIDRAFT_236701 [Lottia gigantea]|uniref:Uncharacterized protein n=1 Tax=Lottia gigantea TaxID=225164 RepID=V4B4P3_LOTGI|nr:hypothetical protein LOTGIDRAFT_236701 [Lottia gigantea]ESO83389.1 hypothetical protein LOTGIDRAFT_236701 [Lottia gigantea]
MSIEGSEHVPTVPLGRKHLTIRADRTTVWAEETYSITCPTNYKYKSVWLRKNKNYIASNRGKPCHFENDVKRSDYRCTAKSFGSGYVLKLTVVKAEDFSTTIQWSCVGVYGRLSNTKSLHIRVVRNVSDLPPMSDQSALDDTTIMLITVCSSVAAMVLFFTMIIGMYMHNKPNVDQAQGPIRSLAKEHDGFPANNDYSIAQRPSSLKYDWTIGDQDFDSSYDADPIEDTPENIYRNFNASMDYGVVNKPDSWTDRDPDYNSNTFYGDAVSNNPNFDPDKIYGLVNKSQH